jgi:UDP:flavonoid glycosyltransferase YjiC (YdhE family)
VTHAGHGTTAKALAAGVPLVALPMGRDQPDIAARVAFAGAGVRLPPGSSGARIARAVRCLLDEPRYAEGARRIAAIMAEEGRRDVAVAELEALVAGHDGVSTERKREKPTTSGRAAGSDR